jgi:hypothetical protein
LAALGLMPAPAGASALSDAAATLAPGTWKQLPTNGASIIVKSNGGDILEYANKGGWNPLNNRAYYCGASHHDSFVADCVQYDEATNSWSSIGVPGTGQFDLVHGYDHNAVDTLRGAFYFRKYNTTQVWKYVPGSGWSSLPTFNSVGGATCLQVAASLEYFAAMDRLVFFNSCGGGLHYYNPATNSWTTQTVSGIPDGGIHTLSASSGHGFYYFGGGQQTNAVQRVSTSQSVSTIATPPGSVQILKSLMVGDPASGRLLFFRGDGNIYEYRQESNQCVDSGVSSRFSGTSGANCSSGIAIPISTYGVIMLACTFNSQSTVQVWLYRHASPSSAPKPQAPSTLVVR